MNNVKGKKDKRQYYYIHLKNSSKYFIWNKKNIQVVHIIIKLNL